MLSYNAGFTEALACVFVTGRVVAADGTALAVFAAIARLDIEVARLAFSTVSANYIGFALTLPCHLVAQRNSVLVLLGSGGITSA